jgi:glutaminyl-peptide cyclotransferase
MLENVHPHSKIMRHFIQRSLFIAAAAASLASCKESPPEQLAYQVISVRPHDAAAYTQGLQLSGGRLFESTGHYGESTVREVEASTGKVLRKRPLAKQYFGEGLTLHAGEVWVLTWKEKTAFVFDLETFKLLRSFPYEGEGWGLTSDGTHLIMSDGSSTLKFMNPEDFSVIKSVEVKENGKSLDQLNELEWINGEIFANLYMSDRIVRISPSSGRVTGSLDLGGLRHQLPRPHRAEVLNGIAWDEKSGHLLVTGKYWPRLFEIQISAKK